MDLLFVAGVLAVLVLVVIVICLMLIYYSSTAYPYLGRHDSEKFFTDPNKKHVAVPFPSISDPATVDLTVVVPAYNEEERLPVMLNEALEYLEDRQKKKKSFKFEIIVVDDGSKDKTSEVALLYSQKYSTEKVRVLTFVKNRGKGGAVRLGTLSARGKQILFADADAATKFSDLAKLEDKMDQLIKNEDDLAVVCGSRAHLQDDAVAQRSLFRTILMYGFHFLVWFLCVRGIKDTQCGFKLLTRRAAAVLFSNLHVERWAFDVDLLYLAQYLKIPLAEVAVNWQEIEGSKMVPFWSWLQMGKDLILIWTRYTIGAWKINAKPKLD